MLGCSTGRILRISISTYAGTSSRVIRHSILSSMVAEG
jgi:hypothetical protein